jgi:hypothetical protein
MNNENLCHKLVFTNEELSVIFEALSNLPYKSAAPIIGTMQQQLQASFEEKKKKFEEEKEKK